MCDIGLAYAFYKIVLIFVLDLSIGKVRAVESHSFVVLKTTPIARE